MKILAGLDQSEYSMKALNKAADLAVKEGAQLTIICVYPELTYGDEMTPDLKDKVLNAARAIGAKGKEEAKKFGVDAEVVALAGDSPAETIVAYAAENGFDLIVTGHKSKKGLEQLMVGSVAGKIVTYAPCSVLVVR